MTCIVGIVEGKAVWIAGDSQATGSEGQRILRADPKVFTIKAGEKWMAVGVCGSYRVAQLLRYSLQVPTPPWVGPFDKWMCTTFIDAVRQCLKDGGFASEENGEEQGGTFMVGYGGQLWTVYSDYQVCRVLEPYYAIGSGDMVALGNLYSTNGKRADERLMMALEAASHHCNSVSRPYHIACTTGDSE